MLTESAAVEIPTPKPVQINQLFSESISNSPFRRTSNFACEDFTHQENVDVFLQKVDEMTVINEEDTETAATSKECLSSCKELSKVKCKTQTKPPILTSGSDAPIHGNSLSNLMQRSWSTDFAKDSENRATNNRSITPSDDHMESHQRQYQRSGSMTSSVSSMRSPSCVDRYSYNTLLKKHETTREFDFAEIWEKFTSLQPVGTGTGTSMIDDDARDLASSGSQVSL